MSVVDRRQDIINELVALLTGLLPTIILTGTQGTPGVMSPEGFVHNRNQLPKGLVPGIILLDGDDLLGPPPPQQSGRAPPQIAPQIMRFKPEIYVVLDERIPNNVNVGEDLSICRQAILSAIWTDKTLISITGPNGRITFDAIVTDLARNRPMEGQMGISPSFYYPLLPGEIVG